MYLQSEEFPLAFLKEGVCWWLIAFNYHKISLFVINLEGYFWLTLESGIGNYFFLTFFHATKILFHCLWPFRVSDKTLYHQIFVSLMEYVTFLGTLTVFLSLDFSALISYAMHGVLNIYSFGGSTEPIGTLNLLFLTKFWRRSWRRTITSSNIFLTHSLSTFSDCTHLYIVPSAVVLLVPQSLLFFSSFCVFLIGLDHCDVHIYIFFRYCTF